MDIESAIESGFRRFAVLCFLGGLAAGIAVFFIVWTVFRLLQHIQISWI
jgi:hypothetical protein